MTREEILAMEPGRELDAAVAEYVLGYKNRVVLYEWADRKSRKHPVVAFTDNPGEIGTYRAFVNEHGEKVSCGKPHWVHIPSKCSTDIADAWEVAEKLSAHETVISRKEQIRGVLTYNVQIFNRSKKHPDECWKGLIDISAKTAPEALCKAALLAVMEV